MKLSKLKLKHVLSPVKWWHFIAGTIIRRLTGGAEYYEQVAYRFDQCRDCVDAGHCHHCGCTMPDAALVKSNKCSAGKWDKMLNKEDWNTYKEIYQL